MHIPMNLATDSGANSPLVRAKRRWDFIIPPCGWHESSLRKSISTTMFQSRWPGRDWGIILVSTTPKGPMPPWSGKHLLKSIMKSQRPGTPELGKGFDMNRNDIVAYIDSQSLVFLTWW